ncbi:hypothetical protein [Sphingobium sp.]|uniref:hypothetical protein n=1 Tax=Sphingobium sp. TaxID=1912891 RepID=UPI002C230A1D|nr:hypothetical protein [Sphingobium sp.]HUD90922.1 hypothetical protein [Sphingobium sp.]
MPASQKPDLIDTFFRSWTSMALAPQKLMQSFNNGWSFANLTINGHNSSAPETEQAIVAVESYGRQIGKLLDAVEALVQRQSDAGTHDAFTELAKLKRRIDQVKHDMAVSRIDQLRGDLDLLRQSEAEDDKAKYEACLAALRQLLADLPASVR